jgi:D-amino peptidase
MKILISADMEGTTGVTQFKHVLPEAGKGEFERIRQYWMGDINAIIEGVLNVSPNAYILVVEAHYEMTYIIPDILHNKAEYISGFFKKNMHLSGIDSSFDGVILFTHSKAGWSSNGVLSHSLVRTIHNLYLNGEVVGELDMNAALAGWYKVPVVGVVGDEETSKEAKKIFGKDFPTAVTKIGLDRFAARCLTPQNSKKIIRNVSEFAIKNIKNRSPWLPTAPFELEIEFQWPTMANACSLIPDVKLINPRTIKIISKDFSTLYNLAHLCALVSVSKFIRDS